MSELAWNREVDVVVVGSGAAGLTAAITAAEGPAQVIVLEKSPFVGGATAVSGGGVWVPRNPHMAEVGVSDTREEALAYARACAAGREPDPALLEAFIDAVLEATTWLEANTPVRFVPSGIYSDYFAERPGAKPLGRTLDPAPFAAREMLGPWDEIIRNGRHYPRLTLDELSRGGNPAPGRDSDRGGGAGAALFSPEMLELSAQRERAGVRTLGGALVSALLRGALDRDVEVQTETPARRLVVEDGAVTGIVTDQEAIAARRGVVLAAGGFEWNQSLVRAFLGVPDLRPASPPVADGDGLLMAMTAGSAIANMTVAWSMPVTYDGRSTYDGHPFHSVGTPRAQAGCIAVNSLGRRFVNEGVCYMDFGRLHRAYDPITQTYPNASPVWLVFDQRVRDRISLSDLTPGAVTPGWVHEAATVSDLARSIGVPGEVLDATIERFNGLARSGADVDFGRGTVWYEGCTVGGPSPERSLAPLESPPYYAMRLYDGALGTAGGALIDIHGRVRRAAGGGTVPGLYAAGNNAASVFGPGYPAGGATLGPAIAFGFRAGRHLAGAEGPVTSAAGDSAPARLSEPSLKHAGSG
jgi:3-oxosteroid 1-dehydrogenase